MGTENDPERLGHFRGDHTRTRKNGLETEESTRVKSEVQKARDAFQEESQQIQHGD